MVKPRRRNNKQKSFLKSLTKKKIEETDDSEKIKETQHTLEQLKERKSQLEALRDKQQKRRRRLLWGEDEGGGDDEGEEDDDEYDEDEEEDDYGHNRRNISEYDSDFYLHENDDDEDCGKFCPNPECRNYSITTLEQFRMPNNPVLIRPYWPSFGPIKRWMFEDISLFDSKGVAYGPVTEYPINSKWMLLSFKNPEDLLRIAEEGIIEATPHTRYYAYVLPVGNKGFYFRDCRSDFVCKRMAMFPQPSLETELPLVDALIKIPKEIILPEKDYKRLEDILSI